MTTLKPTRRRSLFYLVAAAMYVSDVQVTAFAGISTHHHTTTSTSRTTTLLAAPQRLADNVDGVVYVNDKCINCAACSGFSPSVFERNGNAHVVHHQPSTPEEIHTARAAMAACPVAAIRTETLAQRRHRATDKDAIKDAWSEHDEHLVQQMALSPKLNGLDLPFPRPLFQNNNKGDILPTVYYVGHHNDRSFGAIPYLLQANVSGQKVWIMVDTPRFGKPAVQAVTQLTGTDGPDYLVLTHVDDTADHGTWADHFPNMKRIFHAGDTGRHNWLRDHTLEQVEILLPKPSTTPSLLHAYSMDGTLLPDDWWHSQTPLDHTKNDDEDEDDDDDVIILHTPGHSPGSITLWKKPKNQSQQVKAPGILFTGDTYSYTTRNGGSMTGFPRYGNDLQVQAQTLRHLLQLRDNWDVVAPGHGHARDYYHMEEDSTTITKEDIKAHEMEQALQELERY